MKPLFRKLALTAHVTFSVGWLGAVAAFLALAVAGLTNQDPQIVLAAYLAMKLATWFVIVPLAAGSVLSGVVSSLITRWGLVSYYWVLVKLLMTSLATIILLVHTQPIDLLAAAAKTTGLGTHFRSSQLQMVIAAGAGVLVLLVITTLSVYKPQGVTRYGART